jgi:hypothetical protein
MNRKKITAIVYKLFLAAGLGFVLLTCENPQNSNPLNIGLGPRVDMTPPVFTLTAPTPGDFIKDSAGFTGAASDDIAVKSVKIRTIQTAESPWIEVEYDSAGKTWAYTLDTTVFEEGDISVQFRVEDTSGKVTTTENLVFAVKNAFPKIEMQIPLINDADAASAGLNGVPYRLTAGGDLVGIASDRWGIKPNYPLIKFWAVEDYSDGVPPDSQVSWKEVVVSDEDKGQTLKSLQFQFPLTGSNGDPLDIGTAYRFQLKLHDVNGKETIYPPAPDKYVQIALEAQKENPLTVLYPQLFSGEDDFPKGVDFVKDLNSYQNNSFVLRVQTSHSAGIHSAEISYVMERNSGAQLPPIQWVDPAGVPGTDGDGNPVTYFTCVIPKTLDNGDYIFTVTPRSRAGSKWPQPYNVKKDSTPPAITLNELRGSAPYEGNEADYSVNETIRFRLGLMDLESGIYTLPSGSHQGKKDKKYYILRDTSLDNPAEYPPDTLSSGETAVYIGDNNQFDIDTTALEDGEIYYVYIFTRDNALNWDYKRYSLKVDQSSDKPRFSFPEGLNPEVSDPAGLTTTNKLSTGGGVRVRIDDDDALYLTDDTNYGISVTIDKSTVAPDGTVTANGDPKALDLDDLKTIFGTYTGQIASLDREIPQAVLAKALLGDSSGFLPDGLYYLTITAADDPAAKVDNTKLPASTTKEFWIAVDTAPPVIDKTAILPEANTYRSKGTAFSMTGTVEDVNGPVTVSVSLQDGNNDNLNIAETSSQTLQGTAMSWSFDITLVASSTLRITAEDRFGQTSYVDWPYRVDTIPPVVEMTKAPRMTSRTVESVQADNWVNGVIEFTVAVSDEFPITKVKYWLLPAAAPTPPRMDTAGGTEFPQGVRTIRINTAEEISSGVPRYPAGVYNLFVIATDQAGNQNGFGQSAAVPGKKLMAVLRVDQDSDKPWFIDISPSGVQDPNGLKITGHVGDDDGFKDGVSGHPALEIRFNNGGGWSSWQTVSLDLSSGVYTGAFECPVTEFGALGGDGRKDYEIRVTDSGEVNKFPAGGDALYVSSTVAGSFILDSVGPRITVTDPGSPETPSYSTAGSFAVKGKVEEANLKEDDQCRPGITYKTGADEVFLPVSPDPDAAYNPGGVHDKTHWLWELPDAGDFFTGLAEGPHTILFTADDLSFKSSMGNVSFYKDITGPRTLFSVDSMGSEPRTLPSDWYDKTFAEREAWLKEHPVKIISGDSPQISGSFADDYSPVTRFEYRIDDTDDTKPWTPVNIAIPVKTPRWSISGTPVSDLPDGLHHLEIRAYDSVDNSPDPGEVTWTAFRLDRSPPVFGTFTPAEGLAYGTQGAGNTTVFTLTGTAEDANLTEVLLKYRHKSGSPEELPFSGSPTEVDISGPPAGKAKRLNWSFPITLDILNGLGDDGSYTFTLTAVDDEGRKTEKTWRFVRDLTEPSITLSSLANGAVLSDPRIQGMAEDTETLLGRLESRIQKWDYTANSGAGGWLENSDFETWTSLTDAGGTALPLGRNLVNWTKYLDNRGTNPDLPDGRYRIQFRAEDSAEPGNIETTGWTEFYLDRKIPELSVTIPSPPLFSWNSEKEVVFEVKSSDLNRIKTLKGEIIQSGAVKASTTLTNDNHALEAYNVNLKINASGLTGGAYSLRLTVIDNADQQQIIEKAFNLDTTGPEYAIDEPVSQAKVVGSVTVRGRIGDQNGVETLKFYVGPKALTEVKETEWVETWYGLTLGSSKVSLTLTIPEVDKFLKNGSFFSEYDPDDYVTEVDGEAGVYELPIHFRAVDKAGNETAFTHELRIDPSLNIPTVQIGGSLDSPPGYNIRGGEVNLNGSARDNYWIREVVYRVIPIDGGGNDQPPVLMVGAEPEPQLNGSNPAFGLSDGDLGGWMKAALDKTAGAAMVSWEFSVNSNGELDPSGGGESRARIEVRAFDTPLDDRNVLASIGPAQEVLFEFRGGVPTITDITIGNAWGTYPYSSLQTAGRNFSGTVTLKAVLEDDSGLTSIQWRNENQSWSTADNLIANPTYVTKDPSGERYTLTLPLDTKTLLDEKFKNDAGTYTLYLRVQDDGGYQAQEIITINIDNYYPMAGYTGGEIAVGTDFTIQGEAWDAVSNVPPVYGLPEYDSGNTTPAKVVAWFIRSGNVVRLDEDTTNKIPGAAGSPNSAATPVMKGRTGPGVNNAPENVDIPQGKGWRFVIDRSEGAADLNNDGFGNAGWVGTNERREWSVKFNTPNLRDGPLTLCYVVYDASGNASYYEAPVVIQNKPPVLLSVTLGTDFRGLGLPNEETKKLTNISNAGPMLSDYLIRNKYLSFNVETSGGTTPLSYRIHYVLSAAPVSSLTSGKTYAINNAAGTDWAAFGANTDNTFNKRGTVFTAAASGAVSGDAWEISAKTDTVLTKSIVKNDNSSITLAYNGAGDFASISDSGASNDRRFFIKVYDSLQTGDEDKQLADWVIVGLTVDNVDTATPTAVLYNLNPNTENAVAGNLTTTIENAANPTGIGANESRGGLYNTGTARNEKRSGHIEPRIANTLGGAAGTFTRDTVSGRVILRGYASDDQRIKEIKITFGTAGTPLTILTADSADGKLKSPGGGVSAWAVDDIGLLNGHRVEWAYVWDTQALPANTVLKDNVPIEVTVLDGAGNSHFAAVNVDIAPFITGFTRGTNLLNSRSKQGWFAFSRGETIRVDGFNLAPPGGETTLKIGETSLTATGTPQTSEAVSFIIPAASGIGGVKTGPVVLTTTVTVGGSKEAVNNRNDNAKPWNREATRTAGTELWTTDRNAHIWQANEDNDNSDRGYFAGSRDLADPSMSSSPTSGNLLGAWTHPAGEASYLAWNTVAAPLRIVKWGDPQSQTDAYYDSVSETANAVYNNPGSYGDGRSVDHAGGIFLYAPGAASAPSGLLYDGSIFARFDTNYKGNSAPFLAINRFRNPRYVRRDNNHYASYYDAYQKKLKYSYRANVTSINAYSVTEIDGSGVTETANRLGNNTTDGGLYSAIDLDSNGLPVIAYYDSANDTVKLAWVSGASPNWVWTRQSNVLPDAYQAGSGTYISMRIDRTVGANQNRIHLAFYNSRLSSVIYATGTKGSEFTAVELDSASNAGAWSDISLDAGGNPWITYLDMSRVGFNDGAKMAFVPNPAGDNPWAEAKWEAMNIPAPFYVIDDRLSIENDTGDKKFWAAAVGYRSSDYFRIAYYVEP